MSSQIDQQKEFVKVIVYYNKQKFKFKFRAESKVVHIEEFLKRKVQIKPTQSVFLFEKKKKRLLNSGISLAELLDIQTSSKIKSQQADCEIIMRLSQTY